MSEVKILIADDHELVRRGLASIIARRPEWRVVAEVANGADAIKEGELLQPDLAILDLSMPGKNGLEVAKSLRKSMPGIRLIILTMYPLAPIVRRLKRVGVNAYISKTVVPKMLVNVVERVLAGEPFFASTPASPTAGDLEAPEHIPAELLLSPRELEVMRLLALGNSNKEIAFELSIGVRTVETHHANLLEKLNIASVGELARIAIRDGII